MNHQNRSLKLVLAVILGGIAASALLSYAIYRNVLRPARLREDAFAAILDGRLKADAAGTVNLPAEFAAASIDGKAYVTVETTRTLWALFVQDRGSGSTLRGYAFCNQPATARVSTTLELNYPIPTRDGAAAATPPAPTKIIVSIKRVLNPVCYEVAHERG